MTHRAFHTLPRPEQAGILCGEAQFRAFLAARFGYPIAHDPAIFTRNYCGVASRRDLAANTIAASHFDALRTEYDAWRGKIGRPDKEISR